TSPISRMPALAACIPSPIPGARMTIEVSASDAISISDCPTPTVSTTTISQPAASSTRIACGAAADKPPKYPRVAIERMNTPESVACSCIRIRSPSSAPPENGEDGSMAKTPTRLPCRRHELTRAPVEVDLPTPGEPVSPITCASPVCGASCAATSARSADCCSTMEINRATARAWPDRARSTRSETSVDVTVMSDAHNQRVALTASAAEGRRTRSAAASLELKHQMQENPCAAHAQGVTDSDRAAVDVDFVFADPQLARRGDADRGKCLIDFNEVEIGRGNPLFGARLGYRIGRLHLQGGIRAGHHAARAHICDRFEPEFIGLRLAHDNHGGRAIGNLTRRSGGDGAVLGECRTQLRHRFG